MAEITRVLFIGNSFTARNDLPGLLAQLVRDGGQGELKWELISGGGASLRTHLNKGEAQRCLQASRWDYVALQEQSTLPVKILKLGFQSLIRLGPFLDSRCCGRTRPASPTKAQG